MDSGSTWQLSESSEELPTSPLPRVGDVFANYRVEAPLGQGTFGAVFRVSNELGPFALKVLKSPTGEELARFEREVEILRGLSDPGIVRIHESGSLPVPYLVMELCEGPTLKELLRSRRLEVPEAVALVAELARAVSVAHGQGVLHRDLKPANVILRGGDLERPVVMDFGLARQGRGAGLTETGALLGSPAYMAPEQIVDSKRVTTAIDVYALGVLLYECLCGTSPFAGTTAQITWDALQTPAPSPREQVAEVPPWLDALCLSCLAKTADERPSSGELAEALAAGGSAGGRLARFGILAGAVVGLLALGVALWIQSSQPAAPGTPSGATPGSSPLVPSPAESPLEASAPPWYQGADPGSRPPLPIPSGLAWGPSPETYVHVETQALLRWIPSGEFEMGSASGEDMERPLHSRRVEGYFLGQHEVTWGEFARFAKATGRALPAREISGFALPFRASDRHPVFNVTWSEAQAYCAWAGLRLPTEAEWEWAARGPEGRVFPWGASFPDPRGPIANLADRSSGAMADASFGRYERDYEDGSFFPSPVGSYPLGAGPFGHLDLGGNVWEWLAVSYESYPTPGRAVRGAEAYVVRGGSLDNPHEFLSATRRGKAAPGDRKNFIGFRIACSARDD